VLGAFCRTREKQGVWNILKRFKDVLANSHGQSADISPSLQIERELCSELFAGLAENRVLKYSEEI
jgi:hypothetical protein